MARQKKQQNVRPRTGRRANTSRPAITWWSVWQDAGNGWLEHRAGQLGASLAYYAVFSIGPLLLVAIAIAALIFDETQVRSRISEQLSQLVGTNAADGIKQILAGAGSKSTGVLASVLGTAILLVGALGVVVQLKNALNIVFEVPPPRVSGIWAFVRTYAASLAGVMAAGFLLLVSLILSTVLAAAGRLIEPYISQILLQSANVVVSFAMSTAIFSAIFRWLPDAQLRWRSILPGALLTAALFDIGRALISMYIGQQGLESTYGAAGSLVAILIWVYYSSQILLFGAEFVHAYEYERGTFTTDKKRKGT